MSSFEIVLAIDSEGGIGKDGSIPWNLPQDRKLFSSVTQNGLLIMGRKTAESIGRKLPGRTMILLTSMSSHPLADYLFPSLDEALRFAYTLHRPVFVIGGVEIYNQALKRDDNSRVHLSSVQGRYECDTRIDLDLLGKYMPILEEEREGFTYSVLAKGGWLATYNEKIYLSLVDEVIHSGYFREERTSVGTLALFGKVCRYNLEHGFPLLTTKKMAWKAIVEELLWFLRGSTDSRELDAQGVKIWNANALDFAQKKGLNEVGDLGPVYGFSWRHFGAEYHPDELKSLSVEEYNQKYGGVDQLSQVIHLLRTDPTNRRILMTAWNPSVLSEVALPPCHYSVQFFVANGKLSALMNQRSADLGLGVPFNIASYALLVHILAQHSGYTPGELIHVMGDTHVYMNHVEALKEQIRRKPYPLPTLQIRKFERIEDLRLDDFILRNYLSHGTVKMTMAV